MSFTCSCAGPQTYREHLEGQKHKKREAATKMAASVNVTSQNRSGNSLRCQLCDVTCTGNIISSLIILFSARRIPVTAINLFTVQTPCNSNRTKY